MAAQKGKDLLLKIDAGGDGTFVTVAGIRARTLSFNAATVDVTNQESTDLWRELLSGSSVKTARLSGSGVFKDAASDEILRACFFSGTVRDWQAIVPGLGAVEGPFQIASLEYSGRHDAELSFDISLESAGPLSFTAAA